MSGFNKEDLQRRYIAGFADGVSETKGIITNLLKDALQNDEIVISKGIENLFDIINSVGKSKWDYWRLN